MFAFTRSSGRFTLSVFGRWTAVLAVLLAACIFETGTTGGGSETAENGSKGGGSETETKIFAFVAQVDYADGQPAAGIPYRIRNADYLATPYTAATKAAAATLDGETDSAGFIRVKKLPLGAYRLEVFDPDGAAAMGDFTVRDTVAKDTLRLVLAPVGSVRGVLKDTLPTLERWAQVYGLEHLVQVERDGSFRLDNLPPGTVKLRLFTEEPFREPWISESLTVVAGEGADAGVATFTHLRKQGWSARDGRVILDGVSPNSPIIYDNEICGNVADDEYLWTQVSQGKVDLRGFVVTHNFLANDSSTVEDHVRACASDQSFSRALGLRNLPDPIPGADRKLARPSDGYWIGATLGQSRGSNLIVAEANKATPEKPLVVLLDGTPTTLAQAYLTDPRIAANIVAVSMYADKWNSRDTLSSWLVAKKMRFVHWGLDYAYPFNVDSTQLERLPTHAAGLRMRKLLKDNTSYMGDLPTLMVVLRPDLLTGIEPTRLIRPPLVSEPAAGDLEDFLSIPLNGISFEEMEEEFYRKVESASLPRIPLPGPVPAVSFRASEGTIDVSGTPASDAQVRLLPGSSLTYTALLSQRGLTQISARMRARGTGNLNVEFLNPVSGTLALPWEPDTAWQEVSGTWNLPMESFNFRLTASDTLEFEWIEFKP